MSPSAEFSSLVVALVDAFVADGSEKPALPAGRRGEVIALLTRLMGSGRLLDAYCDAVTSERERRGVHRLLLGLPDQEIPDREIAARGFANLSDDELADFALSANALRAIFDYLYSSPNAEPGDWLARAADQADGIQGDGT
jgi:hypothetical protein